MKMKTLTRKNQIKDLDVSQAALIKVCDLVILCVKSKD